MPASRRWSTGYEIGAAGVDDGCHRVAEDVVAVGVRRRLPVLELRRGEDVAGVGEGRYPPAVDERGVPPDVVDMEVRADDGVDGVGGEAGGGEVGQEGELEVVPARVGPRLVVADAGVDGDAGAVDLDHEALDALEEVAVVVDEAPTQPRRLRSDRLDARLVETPEEEARRRLGLHLDNRRDRGPTDLPSTHSGTLDPPHRANSKETEPCTSGCPTHSAVVPRGRHLHPGVRRQGGVPRFRVAVGPRAHRLLRPLRLALPLQRVGVARGRVPTPACSTRSSPSRWRPWPRPA